ncbi:MAG: glycosyltransferase family 2 protein [bacterium]
MASGYSAIVPTYRERNDLAALIQSFPKVLLTSGALEVLVVDNSEGQKATAGLGWQFPFVRVIPAERNLGYAGACNLGAEQAARETLVFLNDDLRLGERWFDAMQEALKGADCAGGLILDWAGKRVDFGGAAMNVFGYGISRHHGKKTGAVQSSKFKVQTTDTPPPFDKATGQALHLPRKGGRDPRRSAISGEMPLTAELFACGASVAVKRDVFRDAGGFDSDYFAFFEDVDFGWRLNLLGYRVVFQPAAVSYHRGGATIRTIGDANHHYYLQRNSLATIYKNYSTDNMAEVLQMAMDAVLVKIQDLNGRRQNGMASAFEKAARDFMQMQPKLNLKRGEVQLRRKRTDEELLPLFVEPVQPAYFNETPKALVERAYERMVGKEKTEEVVGKTG